MGVNLTSIELDSSFFPPIRTLDIRSDTELIKCLESKDHYNSILAVIMPGHKEFENLGSIEKFSETLNASSNPVFVWKHANLYTRDIMILQA